MDEINKIREYRERLDETLACHNLTDEGALRELVANQLLNSSQHEDEAEIQSFLGNRTRMISNFLDMLRSASGKDARTSKPRETSREWKVKQDNEDFRVMYREGSPGTVFHELLVEGYIDGPIDVSLCVSTEAPLYKYWWPQYSVPSFKVLSSERLCQVRIGEQIASVKTKVSWPISSRECLLHYIEFEYFKEDLIIVVINSISGPDGVEKSMHGISKEMIPAEENGIVRMGVVGGFALQKVTNDRSYFRTMGSMDFKLDYVPSWLINFMARQLIGSGFKLYKKAVSSWANNGNEKFQQALQGPLYVRIREALLSNTHHKTDLESNPSVSDTEEVVGLERNVTGADSESDMQQFVADEGKARECSPDRSPVRPKTPPVTDLKVICEIEEEMSEKSVILAEETHGGSSQPIDDQNEKKFQVSSHKKVLMRPEVTEAVAILDRVIAMVRELEIKSRVNHLHSISNENSLNAENTAEEDMSKDDELSLKDLVSIERSKEVIARQTSSKSRSSSIGSSRAARSSFSTKEVSRYAVAPASSPELNVHNPMETTNHGTTTMAPDMGKMILHDQNDVIHDTLATQRKVRQRKNRFCCLNFPGAHGE